MAPYAVRKPYLQLRPELEGCYEAAAPRIVEELATRFRGDPGGTLAYSTSPGQASSLGAASEIDNIRAGPSSPSVLEVVRRWLGLHP